MLLFSYLKLGLQRAPGEDRETSVRYGEFYPVSYLRASIMLRDDTWGVDIDQIVVKI